MRLKFTSCMSFIESYLKEKIGYKEVSFDPEVTEIINTNSYTNKKEEKNPFTTSKVNTNSLGVIQVVHKSKYQSLSSEELHSKALKISK